MLRLGVLDLSPVRSGGVVADAIHETLELAELCDRLGYHRYWLAEHHSTPGLAGSSPEILIGQVATRAGRNLADEDLGARPGQPGCRVVFGEPVAVIAEAVAGLGELECFLDGVGRCPAAAHRRLIEHAEPEHQLSSVRVARSASRATSAGGRAHAAGFGAS